MQMKSIRTGLAVSLAAIASLVLINPMPAMAAKSVDVSVSCDGVDGTSVQELADAIGAYLNEHGIETADGGDVALEVVVAVDDDGEGIAYTMSWDSDGEPEGDGEVAEVDDIAEAFHADLDTFIAEVTAGGDEDGGDDAGDE